MPLHGGQPGERDPAAASFSGLPYSRLTTFAHMESCTSAS